MNATHHSEAAAKKEILKWTSRPAYPTVHSLFIPLKSSAMSDAADEEAPLNGLQIQWHWQAAITPSTLPSPCGEVGQGTIQDPEPRQMSPAHPWLHRQSGPTLPSSPWLHPAHFNLIALPHISWLSRDESEATPWPHAGLQTGDIPPKARKQTNKQRRPLTNQNPS